MDFKIDYLSMHDFLVYIQSKKPPNCGSGKGLFAFEKLGFPFVVSKKSVDGYLKVLVLMFIVKETKLTKA